MGYPCTCTHDLYISFFDKGYISHTVPVFQVPFQGDGDDLHVIVWMCSETFPRSYSVVVEYAQQTEMHPFRIVVICKTEGMVGV